MDAPTPVDPAPELARHLGVGALWIKRDDVTAGLYGGNKVRKLEFLLADARARGAERVVTVGAIGSHHVLATALHGARLGLAVDAVLSPQPPTPHVRDQLRLILASTRRCVLIDDHEVRPRALADLCAPEPGETRGGYPVPAGGSTPVGALGFVSAALELEDQVRGGLLPAPDRIYTVLGSCGTLAGLAVGLRLTRLRTTVHAARVCDGAIASRGHVLRLARRAAALLRRADPTLRRRTRGRGRRPTFLVDDRFYRPGYGERRPDVDQALAVAAAHGLQLDGTYTGRAFAALVADGRAGLLRRKTVVFWQTLSSADLAGPLRRARSREVPAPFARFLEG